jgi:hypothetical protein
MSDIQSSGQSDRLVPRWQQIVVVVITLAAIPIGTWLVNHWVTGRLGENPLGLEVDQFVRHRGIVQYWLAGWIVLAPTSWFVGRFRRRVGDPFVAISWLCGRTATSATLCFFICAGIGTAVSAWFGWPIRNLPPLYHDEYSYLFQAQTILAGRLWFPAHELAPFFDQIHVLNDGVYASRYFPGTGLWLAPFLAAGCPVLGWWVLSGLIAGFAALSGWRFSSIAGYVSGLLAAAAPAIAALGNLLLSPHPTMFAMALFLWAYLTMFERRSSVWPIVAGCAIGFAMMCRPLTAAALGAPFAFYSVYRLIDGRPPGYRRKFILLAASFSAWAAALLGFNAAITGKPWRSPYGVYIDTVTPSHVYGFYNKDRGAARRGEKSLVPYDVWADNLDVDAAFHQLAFRWWRLTGVGFSAISAVGYLTLVILQLPRLGDRVLLLLLAPVGLSAAYLPYWFSGVLGCSYIIESLPCLLVLIGVGVGRLVEGAWAEGRPWVAAWWLMLPVATIALNVGWVIPSFFDPQSILVYPRLLDERYRAREERSRAQLGPILVVIEAEPKNAIQTTLVHNEPTLSGPIVRVWHRGAETRRIIEAFPDRTVWLYRHRDMEHPGQWVPWSKVSVEPP